VRTIADMISTGMIESPADTVDDIIAEVAAARVTERGTRADDKASEAAMEDRKKAGYFEHKNASAEPPIRHTVLPYEQYISAPPARRSGRLAERDGGADGARPRAKSCAGLEEGARHRRRKAVDGPGRLGQGTAP
jgi:hypothetical protein